MTSRAGVKSSSATYSKLPTNSNKIQTYDPNEQFTVGALSRRDLHPDPLAQFRTWFSHAQSKGVPLPETATLSTAHLPSGRVSARMVYLKSVTGGNETSRHDNGIAENRNDPASKLVEKEGFVIYSNWETSRKSHDLRSNPHAALTFWWRELERQVRVEGKVERLSTEESQAYFDTRIRGSRIGAWASPQSQVLKPIPPGIATEATPPREQGDGSEKAMASGVLQPSSNTDLRKASSPSTEAPYTSPSGTIKASEKDRDDGRAALEHRVQEIEERFSSPSDQKIPVPPFWGGIKIIPDTVEFWQGRPSRLHDRFRYTKLPAVEGAEAGGGVKDERGNESEAGAAIDGTADGEGGRWRIERLAP